MLSPCVNCEEREAGCHGSCGAYKGWRERYDAAKAARRKGSPAAAYLSAWKRKKKLHEQRHKRK
jgi:hypothetical protein